MNEIQSFLVTSLQRRGGLAYMSLIVHACAQKHIKI